MKGRKRMDRLQRRQKAWDKHYKDRDGYKRPGSYKKAYPKGSR